MSGDFTTLGDWADVGKQAAGVILADQHGRLLMQLRDINDRTAGPGLWSIFGGEVEAGESLKAAALREFTEETGLELTADALRPLACALSVLGTRLYAFSANMTVDPSQIRLGEGAGFAFLTQAQINTLPLMPAAGMILDHYFTTSDPQS